MDMLQIPGKIEFLTSLAGPILTATRRQDTKHALFSGCIDWHSAVHGHWALLRIANAAGIAEAAARAAAESLCRDELEAERSFIASRPYFEMPYGRAWFLLLELEYRAFAARTGSFPPDRLQPMAADIAASLLAYHSDRPPYAETMEYVNDAWPLLRLHEWCRRSGETSTAGRIEKAVERRFLGEPQRIGFGDDSRRPEFFSRFGNLAALVARAAPDRLGEFLEAHPVADNHLAPLDPLLPAAHHLGMNWSRAWALRILASAAPEETDKQRFEAAFLAHAEVAIKHHAKHASEYLSYGHWVPQFAVLALTEGDTTLTGISV